MFTAYYPFTKFFGFRLNDWEFYAILGLPEKIKELNVSSHVFISSPSGEYNWLKCQFLFRKISVRPINFKNI